MRPCMTYELIKGAVLSFYLIPSNDLDLNTFCHKDLSQFSKCRYVLPMNFVDSYN